MSKILIDEATVKLVLRSLRELVPDDSDHAPALQGQRMRQKKAIDAAREALAEQPAQQEPAFYRHEDGHLMTPYRAKFLGLDLNELQPLYTSPPAQRTWVGLTDWERDDVLDNYFTDEGRARAIEAKLRSKNEDRN